MELVWAVINFWTADKTVILFEPIVLLLVIWYLLLLYGICLSPYFWRLNLRLDIMPLTNVFCTAPKYLIVYCNSNHQHQRVGSNWVLIFVTADFNKGRNTLLNFIIHEFPFSIKMRYNSIYFFQETSITDQEGYPKHSPVQIND